MTKDRGSTEWFKREKFQLIEQLKAVDSFAAAARCFQKLVQMGDDADTEARSALHTAAVVHYGRPFSHNRSAGGAKFAPRVIKQHAQYDAEIHRLLSWSFIQIMTTPTGDCSKKHSFWNEAQKSSKR